MQFQIAALLALTAASASAQTVTLFGQSYQVQRFDYKQSIRWTNPVAPFNDQGLIRVEGAWSLANGHMYVVTSHQDQSVPATYANFVLEIAPVLDPQGSVTGLQYVRTVVANDPALLGSSFDLRGEGLAVNPTNVGLAAGGQLVVADNQSGDILRAYDLTTGALIPYGPGNVGLPVGPTITELNDATLVAEGPSTDWRLYALDGTTTRVYSYLLDGTPVSNFAVAGASNPLAAPGDPKSLAYLADTLAYPELFHGSGGVLLVGLGDLRAGLQAFTKTGVELGFEPIDNTVFQTSSAAVQPKIEAIATDPATGRLFLYMEKGSLVDDWAWVLTPDCNGNLVADARDLVNGTDHDHDANGVLDGCEATGVAYCFGDGSGTACPCGNASLPSAGSGCLNSFAIGARISAVGTASLANDTLILGGDGMPNASALYLQGDAQVVGGLGSIFGDGLRCAGGTVVRLKTTTNVAGSSTYPGPGDLSVSVRGGVVAAGVRHYQVWYRNAAAFCTSGTFNLSNGLTITWVP